MVIPWVGIPLKDIIATFQPTSQAKYVEFVTALNPAQMPGQTTRMLPWPYVEGLRMDEAMNPLAILAVGLYEETLPNQDGAPIRLVTPWKYGFKGVKSIVKIRFVDYQPKNTWQVMAPSEYGFYANVNPAVSHPRWSQAQASGASASSSGARRCRSTDTPTRSRRCTRDGPEKELLKPIVLLKRIIFAAALIPAAALIVDALHGQLTANPIDYITDTTGDWALRLLMITLCITPIRRITGWNPIIQPRRMLGLFSFFYATLHFLTWSVLDWFFDFRQMGSDIVMRPFITLGMATFLMLLALAVTSTKASIRRLGKKWTQLHRLIYVAAITALTHFWLGRCSKENGDRSRPAAGFRWAVPRRVSWAHGAGAIKVGPCVARRRGHMSLGIVFLGTSARD